jgi:hypothetical protein
LGEDVVAISPTDILNPIHVDTVIPGSPSVITTDDRPGIFIVKIQAADPPDQTSLHTFLFHLNRSDAIQLQRALSVALQGTSN